MHNVFFKMALFVCMFLFFSCETKIDLKDKVGCVFVSEEIAIESKENYKVIHPILAFRIDNVVDDTIHMKYRFGQEAHMDVDLLFEKECNCYKSLAKLLFAPYGKDRSEVFLKVVNFNKVELFYNDQNEKKTFIYNYSYQDNINLTTYRDSYYAEDGFKLFKED